MKNLNKFIVGCCLMLSSVLANAAWPGMPLPPLHVSGRNLVDNCGNNVVLHGVAITPSPWFNGCQYGSNSQYCTWDNYDVAGALAYNKAVMNKLTDTSDGWHLNYIRLHIDPYWTNNPGPPIPENDISRFNFDRLVQYTDEVIIPLINHARERGMYVILRPPGVCPTRIAVNDNYHNYLKTIWNFLSNHPSLKNVENVMFELANEPVEILGTNGQWGSTGSAHFEALKNFFQPIVNNIRSNGANNVLWIPGSGWQSHYQGYVDYPITGGNIGYAVHIYPGYWGGVRNYNAFQAAWDINVKPIADIAPIAVTETDWAPEGYDTFGVANTGTAGGQGFGANLNLILFNSGNASWNVLAPDNLLDHGDPNGGIAYGGDWQACAAPVKHWFSEYANNDVPSLACSDNSGLINNGVYEIEFKTTPLRVLDLKNGEDANGAVVRPWERNGEQAQKWIAKDAGNGYWRFVSAASSSNRVIDLQNGDIQPGTTIHLWDNYSNDAQAWRVIDLGDGYKRVESKLDPNSSWDVNNCNMDGSVGLRLFDYLGTACQKFKFNLLQNTSAATNITVTNNVPEDDFIDSFFVYPNPSINGDFNMSMDNSKVKDYSITIFDIQGNKVFEKKYDDPEQKILQTGLSKGIYFLKVTGKNISKSKKIIVK
ncbi:RICIN domain-containing protein [Zunongwangia pacifica]|uniref:RICIN domain-containing protein n=1 Tax=Zunongwangia pacifica TaxID=2911062 RepID=A0A9X2CMI6_9FLAO|nr:RICIN domain-containing protein [Zunongwangia pacifica]MCL6219525.1 RICIN domain-containing protein [Zunongwangia pacifica]